VGEEIMAVVVGGDTRDHVFPALMSAVNRLKAEATTKKELY
jgi:molybdopterin synthase catalytic subunit